MIKYYMRYNMHDVLNVVSEGKELLVESVFERIDGFGN